MKTCPQCGVMYEPRSNNNKFCSTLCQARSRYPKNQPDYKPLPPKPCVICGEIFQPERSYRKTCGSEICQKHNRAQIKAAYKQKQGAGRSVEPYRKVYKQPTQCRFPGCFTPTRDKSGYCSPDHKSRHAIAMQGAAVLREFAAEMR